MSDRSCECLLTRREARALAYLYDIGVDSWNNIWPEIGANTFTIKKSLIKKRFIDEAFVGPVGPKNTPTSFWQLTEAGTVLLEYYIEHIGDPRPIKEYNRK